MRGSWLYSDSLWLQIVRCSSQPIRMLLQDLVQDARRDISNAAEGTHGLCRESVSVGGEADERYPLLVRALQLTAQLECLRIPEMGSLVLGPRRNSQSVRRPITTRDLACVPFKCCS